jgi:hypothetical protein
MSGFYKLVNPRGSEKVFFIIIMLFNKPTCMQLDAINNKN